MPSQLGDVLTWVANLEGAGAQERRLVVIAMMDEYFNFNLLLTLVCTQHVNKFNLLQAGL